ncbi:IS3 family transposase [Niallia taxi]|uniref:IS3 family transposase n=1 Tax=Niallia taxi TaxID=2499688 RepID=A0A437K2F0_9BACI|nr:IS3 family transposase [Niallia taxi]RVT56095.1 IS3 family transposase [Niallia taxi]
MAKKGQTFQSYSSETKLKAVIMYENGEGSYNSISEELGLRSSTQLKDWVKKYRKGESFHDLRGSNPSTHPFIGRPKTKFNSVEEERDYLKAQVEYLKKRLSKSTRRGEVKKSERFKIINEMRSEYPVTWLVEIAKVSRAGYYKWESTGEQRRERLERESSIKGHILAVHRRNNQYGYPRLTTALKDEGLIVNHKRIYRLMKDLGIQSIIRKKRRFFGKEASNVYPNMVNRQFKDRKFNEVLVTDITYIPFQNRFYYLSVVQDLYNNEIVAWKLSNRNDIKLVLDTVEQVTNKRNVHGTILHSDQGFQYTSRQYSKRLSEKGILGSHSRKGNCLDNACIESFFSHFKTEKLYQINCKTEHELEQAIEDYMYEYNYKRFQKRLNQCAPVEYRVTLAA